MIRLEAPSFVAGLVVRRGVVVDAPPIVAYMIGWGDGRARSYAARRGWRVIG